MGNDNKHFGNLLNFYNFLKIKCVSFNMTRLFIQFVMMFLQSLYLLRSRCCVVLQVHATFPIDIFGLVSSWTFFAVVESWQPFVFCCKAFPKLLSHRPRKVNSTFFKFILSRNRIEILKDHFLEKRIQTQIQISNQFLYSSIALFIKFIVCFFLKIKLKLLS